MCLCGQRETLDEDCVTELAVHYNQSKDEMRQSLLKVSSHSHMHHYHSGPPAVDFLNALSLITHLTVGN